DLDCYVPDTDAGQVVIWRSPVVDNDGLPIEIGGTPLPDRLERVHQLGERLAPMAVGWLARLRSDPATAHRARVLLPTNSYSQTITLANAVATNAEIGGGRQPAVIAAVPDDPDA